jgi:hypothetical protein
LLAVLLALFVVASSSASDGFGPKQPEVPYPVYPYDGEFTLARIKFEPMAWGPSRAFTWGLDLKWNHDYPQAEQNFSKILSEVTKVRANAEGGNIVEITDPTLFDHPWAYICEVGFWDPTDEEIEILRQYLFKGGFLMIDDFIDVRGDFQWRNFAFQMRRLLPEHRLVKMQLSDGVFHTFFPMESLDLNDPRLERLDQAIYGVYEDNDPNKRLMMVVNYNMDVGDFWEWSDQAFYPVDLTQRGFKLGVNYVIYGLTH